MNTGRSAYYSHNKQYNEHCLRSSTHVYIYSRNSLTGLTKLFSLSPSQLVESIWVEDPHERPSFQQVLKKLNALSPQQGDLMDNLVSMVSHDS